MAIALIVAAVLAAGATVVLLDEAWPQLAGLRVRPGAIGAPAAGAGLWRAAAGERPEWHGAGDARWPAGLAAAGGVARLNDFDPSPPGGYAAEPAAAARGF